MLYCAEIVDHYCDPYHYPAEYRAEARSYRGVGWGKTPLKALERARQDQLREYRSDPERSDHHLVLVTKVVYDRQGREFLNLGD
jgi:hypothetical protein